MKIVSIIKPLDIKLNCQDVFYILNITEKPDYISFLDSSLLPNKYSNFSYIAWEPDFVIRGFSDKNEVLNMSDNSIITSRENPLFFLKNIFGKNIFWDNGGKKLNFNGRHFITEIKKIYIDGSRIIHFDNNDEIGAMMPDFVGGFVGYISYDLKNYIERLPQTVKDDINNPLFYFAYYSRFLAYSHKFSKWFMINNFALSEDSDVYENSDIGKNSDSDINSDNPGIKIKNTRKGNSNLWSGLLDKSTYRSSKIIQSLTPEIWGKKESIKELIIKKYLNKKIDGIELKSNFTKNDYLKAVLKAKEYIYNGDIYQVNMTQRFNCNLKVEPYDLYYILRQKNAAPFSAYLGFPELKVGSSSPERFLFLKEGIIETRPIKGTRPRGNNDREDEMYIDQLKNSIKDRAELNMIVDLERNDLGRFCKYGTVKVKEHAVVEKYARVFHLVSTVIGRVKEGYDIVDILRAAFPGGSITGAPKIRAMEIIDELEPTIRGVYTGTIGYVGVDGTLDLNIVIRTFIIKGQRFYYNVGGGIVEDSEPYAEYQETLDKGLALKETLEFFSYKNLSKLL